MTTEDRHGLALLQLTRILFLYFIQTKGWLAGRERFLAEEVERCLAHRRRIHRDLLRPLFFGTLNRPRASTEPGRQFVRLHSLPQRRPVRAPPSGATLPGRHSQCSLARRLRPALRAISLHGDGRHGHGRRGAGHAGPCVRRSHGSGRSPRLGHVLHPRVTGWERARCALIALIGNDSGAVMGKPSAPSRPATPARARDRWPHHPARSGGWIGCISAWRPRTSLLHRSSAHPARPESAGYCSRTCSGWT